MKLPIYTDITKKALCVLLAVLLLSLCGCSGTSGGENGFQALFRLDTPSEAGDDSRGPEEMTELNLPYDPDDTRGGRIFDPYCCKTSANRYICALVYDPLFRIDENCDPQPCIAESAEYSSVVVSEYETSYFCVVTLKEGLLFSDGSEVTLSDVMYSISLAMSQDSVYAASLSNVASYSRSDSNRITFKLYAPDNMFASLLSFPIVQKPTGDNQAYIGSGRYRPILVGDSIRLLQNENRTERGPIRLISLVEVEDGNMLMYGLKTGAIDFAFFDLSEDASYSAASGSEFVQLNNMVFLGFNGYSRHLSNPGVRRAISALIDREALTGAYYGMAAAAYAPQNPLYSGKSSVSDSEETAQELLLETGFEKDAEGFFSKNGSRLELTLLVNREDYCRLDAALLIARQLTEAGIAVEISEKTFAEYSALLSSGDYDLYLGEMKLKYNMDISALLPGGSQAYFTAEDEEFSGAYLRWRSGGSLLAFNSAFREHTPFAPLLFRFGFVSFSRSLSYDIIATEQDIFYNITDW